MTNQELQRLLSAFPPHLEVGFTDPEWQDFVGFEPGGVAVQTDRRYDPRDGRKRINVEVLVLA